VLLVTPCFNLELDFNILVVKELVVNVGILRGPGGDESVLPFFNN